MKLKSTSLLIAGVLLSAAVVPAQANNNDAMMNLLKVLRDKGTLSAQDYDLLTKAAAVDGEQIADNSKKIKEVAAQASNSSVPAWVKNTKVSGDFRGRYENVNYDHSGVAADRLRIRARIGIDSKINDNAKLGFRLATGASKSGITDAGTSTNQTLGDNFSPKSFNLDRAFLDWNPASLGGNSHFVFGKMPQQWQEVTTLVWDDDLNPEGVAYRGSYDMGGFTLMPSAAYYDLLDISGYSISKNYHVSYVQLAAKSGGLKGGVSYYGYQGSTSPTDTVPVKTEYKPRIWEVFGSYELPLTTPVTVYAMYAKNDNVKNAADYGAIRNDSNAYAVGASTKISKLKLKYEYRDNGTTAMNYMLNDSDFQDQAKGSILKASYPLDKNLDLAGAFMYTKSNLRNDTKGDRTLFQLDLNAKF